VPDMYAGKLLGEPMLPLARPAGRPLCLWTTRAAVVACRGRVCGSQQTKDPSITMERLTTGIPGLDTVLGGGLPASAVVVVGGPPGAGKTVLSVQVAFHQAALGRRALLLTTLSEPHEKLIRHTEGFAWFDPTRLGTQIQYLSLYDALQDGGASQALETVVEAARAQQADLLILDAFRGVRDLVADELALRRFIFELGGQLGVLGVTALLTGEYAREDIERYVEFTVADGIIHLNHGLVGPRQSRTIEVVKMRGSGFLGGLHTLHVDEHGISVYPRHPALARRIDYSMGSERLSSGVPALDAMLGGGFVAHSLNLIVGTPGVGKTLLGLQFLAEGARQGERGVMMSLDESGPHLEQKALHFKLTSAQQPFFDGEKLSILWEPAVETEVDVVASHLRDAIEGRGVKRLVLDAMANIEGALQPAQLNDYIMSLTNYLRGHGVTVLMINDMAELAGGVVSVGGFTFSATADNILLMRQAEVQGRLQLALAVVKMRDSAFDPGVRQYTIEQQGLRIGEPLRTDGDSVRPTARLRAILTEEPGSSGV
jgi:circadian clock protein KaiC